MSCFFIVKHPGTLLHECAIILRQLGLSLKRHWELLVTTPVPLGAVYHAIYLEELTAAELTEKIAQLFSISSRQISQIYKQGPTGIHVLISNEVTALVGGHWSCGDLVCLDWALYHQEPVQRIFVKSGGVSCGTSQRCKKFLGGPCTSAVAGKFRCWWGLIPHASYRLHLFYFSFSRQEFSTALTQ